MLLNYYLSFHSGAGLVNAGGNMKNILLLMLLIVLSGCDDVPGQYRHDQTHHKQQEQLNN